MTGKELLRLTSPIIDLGAVWVGQKAMSAAYRGATGREVPVANDLNTPVVRVLLYASAAAVLGAIITTSVNRVIAQATQVDPEII
jgi:hypothetical protein